MPQILPSLLRCRTPPLLHRRALLLDLSGFGTGTVSPLHGAKEGGNQEEQEEKEGTGIDVWACSTHSS